MAAKNARTKPSVFVAAAAAAGTHRGGGVSTIITGLTFIVASRADITAAFVQVQWPRVVRGL